MLESWTHIVHLNQRLFKAQQEMGVVDRASARKKLMKPPLKRIRLIAMFWRSKKVIKNKILKNALFYITSKVYLEKCFCIWLCTLWSLFFTYVTCRNITSPTVQTLNNILNAVSSFCRPKAKIYWLNVFSDCGLSLKLCIAVSPYWHSKLLSWYLTNDGTLATLWAVLMLGLSIWGYTWGCRCTAVGLTH